MLHKLRVPAIIVLVGVATLWVGKSLFSYLTHNTAPEIALVNLENGKIYGKTHEFFIKSSGDYKISQITAQLDGKDFDLGPATYPGKAVFQLPVKLDTIGLENGKHKLTLEATDGSYNKNKQALSCEFDIDNTPLNAALLN